LSIKDSWRKIDNLKLSDFEKISLFDIEQYLAYNLLYKMDIASMANSLEVRNPYLDYRVMEYCFNMPQELKVKDGTQKYLLKKLLERFLQTNWCTEKNGVSRHRSGRLSKELAYLIDKWLAPGHIKAQGLFNEKRVSHYVMNFAAEKNITTNDFGP